MTLYLRENVQAAALFYSGSDVLIVLVIWGHAQTLRAS